MSEKTIAYTKYEWKEEGPKYLIATEKTVAIKDDLFINIGSMGVGQFLRYMPLDRVEDFFRTLAKGGENTEHEDYMRKTALNNFSLLMPGQKYDESTIAMSLADQKKTLRHILIDANKRHALPDKTAEYNSAALRYIFSLHSDKRLEETADQFHNNIYQAIMTCGYSLEGVQKAAAGGMVQAVEFYKTYWPIYIELRKMGYAHRDLVA